MGGSESKVDDDKKEVGHSHSHVEETNGNHGGCCDQDHGHGHAHEHAETHDHAHEHGHGGGGCCDKGGDEMPSRMKAAMAKKETEQTDVQHDHSHDGGDTHDHAHEHGHGGGGCCDGGDEMPSRMKAAMEKKAKLQAEAEQKGLATAAPEVSLMVNGINCGGCKKAVNTKLRELPGVTSIDITTKKDSGVHPNKVVVKGALGAEQVKQALAELDAGRDKYTVEA